MFGTLTLPLVSLAKSRSFEAAWAIALSLPLERTLSYPRILLLDVVDMQVGIQRGVYDVASHLVRSSLLP